MTSDDRRWAVEQAIKLHGQHGCPTSTVIDEAKTILAFVAEPPHQTNLDAQVPRAQQTSPAAKAHRIGER